MLRGRRRATSMVALLAIAVFSAGCLAKPPPNANFDYQIGGAYPPPDGVSIVARDRLDPPAPGKYNICYVNGFQAQTEDESWWLTNHPTLVLRDGNGVPIKDTDWNELILDISTPAKRAALADIVGAWLQGCATAGFKGVDLDNLDTYSRSQGRLNQGHAVEYVRLLSTRGHAAGLAMGQKNATELVPRRAEMGLDFVVAEECNRYDECDDYTAGYGTSVFVIEYRRADFDEGCAAFPELSIVLRDLDVSPAGSPGYVRDAC